MTDDETDVDRVDRSEAADVCDRAADVILANGWHQGALWPGRWPKPTEWTPGTPVCLVGSLRVAVGAVNGVSTVSDWGNLPRALGAYDAVKAKLRETEPGPLTWDPAAWNDHPERTADEVIETLRQTAKTLREDA